MNNSIRRTLVVATGIAALGAGSLAFAGLNGFAAEKVRERSEDRQDSQQQQQQQQSAPAPRQNSQPARQSRPAPAPAAAAQAPAPRQPGTINRGGNNRGDSSNRNGNRGGVGDALSRTYRAGDQGRDNGDYRGGSSRGDRGDYRGDRGDRGGNNYQGDYRRPRVVQTLPRGYRNYNWNGRPYYQYGGSWYRPYGGSYLSIGVPYGLFVTSLSGAHSSFWYGSTRYYYADDTYYLYEPARRGYVVTRSPYADERDDDYGDDGALDEDLYIYPARGQSEQQQADDRYECHRWAAQETDYDPIDDAYQPDDRADYLRAMTACLTGRGYSVR